MVQTIYQCPVSPAVYSAQTIVEIKTGEEIPECSENEIRSLFALNQDESDSNTEVLLGENFPDPYANTTVVPCTITDDGISQLVITDVLGRTIQVIELNPGTQYVQINSDNWEKGIYYYSLISDGVIVATKKMVLIK
jgi:hypothetical protein